MKYSILLVNAGLTNYTDGKPINNRIVTIHTMSKMCFNCGFDSDRGLNDSLFT